MKLRRREFIHRAALGVGGLVVAAPGTLHAQSAAARARVDPYALVQLGRTPLKVSRFCLGTGMRGGNRESNHTRMGKQAFEALIRESFDRGTRCTSSMNTVLTPAWAASSSRSSRPGSDT